MEANVTAENLDTLTVDELIAENQRLQRMEDDIREAKIRIKAAIDAKAAEEEAARLVAGLSPEQREAVARVARAEVNMGTPGN